MGNIYVNGTAVGTHDITAPAIPTEVWYVAGGVCVLLVVGALVWLATKRRG